jgi:hypothetical protein
MSQQEVKNFNSLKHGKEEFINLKGGWPGTSNPTKQVKNITFTSSFGKNSTPLVNLSVVGLDVGGTNDETHNVRYKVYYEDLDRDGFKLVVETWYTTIINLIQVEWIAID